MPFPLRPWLALGSDRQNGVTNPLPLVDLNKLFVDVHVVTCSNHPLPRRPSLEHGFAKNGRIMLRLVLRRSFTDSYLYHSHLLSVVLNEEPLEGLYLYVE